MRIVVVSDAWHPQVSGVVRTYEQTARELRRRGHEVDVIGPEGFRTVPCPTYPSIPLAVLPRRRLRGLLARLAPDAVHVATEGPLGRAARSILRAQRLAFTTCYHTQLPEYVRARAPVPLAWTYRYLRRFHAAAAHTLVPSPSLRERLARRGFTRLAVWSRGVDARVFRPWGKDLLPGPRPRLLYMGRVAVEKNVEAFLRLRVPGTKYVVGDGPDRARLEACYPEARFLGERTGEDLARHVASAEAFVFPSLTDTFGVVLLEALACGVPVAAYPVTGPIDVVEDGRTGALDADLGRAVHRALAIDPGACVAFARTRTWAACTDTFESLLVPARG